MSSAGALATRLFTELTVDDEQQAAGDQLVGAGDGEGDAEPTPMYATRWDLEELAALRRAHARGDADGGLTRELFHEAFASHLPAYSIDRLFAALARPVTVAPKPGDVREPAAAPQLRVSWVEWVDGLAAAAKPPPAAHALAAANASRLLALFDLFASELARPSEAVLALDELASATDAFQASAPFAGAFPERAADEHERAAAFANVPCARTPAAVGGALDGPSLLALLSCCMRQCVDPARLAGASAGLAPLVRGALLNGPLSRAGWLRWAAAAVPRLGSTFELLVLRGVCALAKDAALTHSASRLADACWLPYLVGGDPPEAPRDVDGDGGKGQEAPSAKGGCGGGAVGSGGSPGPSPAHLGSTSPLLPTALQWAVCLSLPEPPAPLASAGASAAERGAACGGGAGVLLGGSAAAAAGWPETWRRLYSSAEHGLAINRLTKHTVGYAGPTLLVVQEAPPLGSRAPSSSSVADGSAEPGAAGGAAGGASAAQPAPPAAPVRWAALVDEAWHAVAPGQAFGGDGCVAYELLPRFHPHRVASAGARHCASLVLPVHALLAAPSHLHRDSALAMTGPAAGTSFGLGASRSRRASEPADAQQQALVAIGGGLPQTPRTPATPGGGAGRSSNKHGPGSFGGAAVNAAIAGAEAQHVGGGGGGAAGGARRAVGAYRASLSADLTQSLWQHHDETYEDDMHRLQMAGEAADRPPMRVAIIEVWGLGGPAADSAQHRAQAEAERARVHAARVSRAAFGESWADSADRMLLEYGGRSFFSGEAHSLA